MAFLGVVRGLWGSEKSQKNPRVRKIFVRNSGVGNGCVNFMDARKKCVLSAGKTHVHKIPRFGGGGYFGFLGGGGADFIFMGARIFLKKDKLGRKSPDRETPAFATPPRLPALESWELFELWHSKSFLVPDS